jgi:excisionase family DNA binding protein
MGAMAATGQYLTLLEAAAFLRVSPRTLSKWAHAGHVPGRKDPGGRWRFYKPDLVFVLGPVHGRAREDEGGASKRGGPDRGHRS